MKIKLSIAVATLLLIASCGGNSNDNGGGGGDEGIDNTPEQQSPMQTNRYVTNTSCSVSMTYSDAYGQPTRYTLMITTYYSDGTQSSTAQSSSEPC